MAGGDKKKPTLASLWNKKFTLSNLRHNWELGPLVSLPILVVSGAIFMLFRTATGAADVRWTNKSDGYSGPHERIRPDHNVKMYTPNPGKYKPIPEVEAIKDDLKHSAPNK